MCFQTLTSHQKNKCSLTEGRKKVPPKNLWPPPGRKFCDSQWLTKNQTHLHFIWKLIHNLWGRGERNLTEGGVANKIFTKLIIYFVHDGQMVIFARKYFYSSYIKKHVFFSMCPLINLRCFNYKGWSLAS